MIKLMYTGPETSLFWDMRSEQNILLSPKLQSIVSETINLDQYLTDFSFKFESYLEDDSKDIFNIYDPVNYNIVDSLDIINRRIGYRELFYWFDIDRNENNDFIWQFCPISNMKLINLGNEFHENNPKSRPRLQRGCLPSFAFSDSLLISFRQIQAYKFILYAQHVLILRHLKNKEAFPS